MNWTNVDLNSHEVESYILNPYSFKILLLEIDCNLSEINEDSVRQQFLTELEAKVSEAKEIFEANISNIVEHAKANREEE